MSVTDAELLAALLARLGGTVLLTGRELEAAKGWRLVLRTNPVTGDCELSLVE